MNRPDRPFEMEVLERPHAPLGDRRLRIALSDVRLELRGIDESLLEKLLPRYGPFVEQGAGGEGTLRVDVVADGGADYYIQPPQRPELNPVLLAVDGERVRYLGYRAAGWFDCLGGRGRLILAGGDYEPADGAVENFIRSAVAWQAAGRGGALVHAASAVWRNRGYLFYGESGAGKSTLSECNRRARVVSDDLSLVLPRSGGGLDLVGSPFRGTYEGGETVIGRFPLVAGFRIIQAAEPDVRDAPRARAVAELVGNLPFVAEAYAHRPDLFSSIERAFAGLPLKHLHFRKDDDYWDAIDRAGL